MVRHLQRTVGADVELQTRLGQRFDCVVVDMTADTMEPVHRTSDHNPSNAKETQRMEWEWQVRAGSGR